MKKIVVLGSTGSVGVQTLDVVHRHPDRFQIVALTASTRWEQLAEQAEACLPRLVALRDREGAARLRERLAAQPRTASIEVLEGTEGVVEAARLAEADMVVASLVGVSGLLPTLAAIEAGHDIALANKETLVVGGDLVTAAAKQRGVNLRPIDSEHSALFQCLVGEDISKVERLVLTNSGGPFRTWPAEKIETATVRDALKHPTWSMGSKITIDSSTLMNKGFEVIEAWHLFGVGFDRIDVIVHPQSVIHSLVEFVDGSVMAQLGTPDMRLPVQYALAWPERLAPSWNRLDLRSVASLTFEEPRRAVFPCLDFAYEAGRRGGTQPCALNAANEVAVELFLKEQIDFVSIPRLIEAVMQAHAFIAAPNLDDLLATDLWCRERAHELARTVGRRPARLVPVHGA